MTMPAAYSAIKGGLNNLTRYLASYFGEFCPDEKKKRMSLDDRRR